MPNPCRNSLSGAACTPPEIFLPLLLQMKISLCVHVRENELKSCYDVCALDMCTVFSFHPRNAIAQSIITTVN